LSVDEILAKEAQLTYTRAPGFYPVDGNLKHWKGSIKVRTRPNEEFIIEIMIPDDFPIISPKVIATTPIRHRIVDPRTLLFDVKILNEWNPNTHLYDIVNVIKGEFARNPPEKLGALRPIIKPIITEGEDVKVLDEKLKSLEGEVEGLQKKIVEKDEEVGKLQDVLKTHKDKTIEQIEAEIKAEKRDSDVISLSDLEGEKIAIEELVRKLEEKFEAGDITVEDYTRIYKKYRKQLFTINKKISEAKK
jgi:ubiquitin-protein ligase